MGPASGYEGWVRILVVDDEAQVAAFLRQGLAEEGHEVVVAHDGEAALRLAPEAELLILDVMLPGRSGLEVCAALRGQGAQQPILMLSARGEPSDRVLGLKGGADDYLAKPFSFEELLARVEALGRRVAPRHDPTHGELRLDLARREAVRGAQRVELTGRELDLLVFFMGHPEAVHDRETLAREVWRLDFDPGTNVVDVYVAYLRRKLEKLGLKLVHTVRGAGYRFGSPPP